MLAFPSAVGFGKNSVGGRGGQVLYVTNLNDTGSGSFREACEANFPRIVLFKVGGLINLTSTINITNPNISILGQSASGDGIVLTVEGTTGIRPLQISTNEVIIRYIKIRVKSSRVDTSTDGIYIESGYNIIIDHCSVAFATDELLAINVLTANGVGNITIQNCILSNAFGGSASKGALCARNIEGLTFYKNLFASNLTRNPYLSVQDSNPDIDLKYEIVNNVMYNTKYYVEVTRDDNVDTGGLGVPSYNVINNYAKLSDGLPYPKNVERNMILNYSNLATKIYAKGNIHPLRPTITNNVDYTQYTASDWDEEWSTTQGGDGIGNLNNRAFAGHQVFVPIDTPIINDNVILTDADVLWETIRDDIGASYPTRDSHDVQMVDEVNTGNRADNTTSAPLPTYNNPNNNTPSYTDSNNDGIDDTWFSINVTNGDIASDVSPNGYTWVEIFQNEIIGGIGENIIYNLSATDRLKGKRKIFELITRGSL